jgi:lipid-A-disaccharide synthase
MAGFIDHMMALLPFEPDVHQRLGGPPCTYVGHPLLDRLASLRPAPGERPALANVERPTLLLLPGSRHSEVVRLMSPFGEAIADATRRTRPPELLLPAVPHLIDEIRAGTKRWPVQPTIIEGEEAKFAAFRRAHAALAASGTATLELALAGVPLVVGYRLDWLARRLRWLISVRSIVLANLILDENVVPEFIDENCNAPALSAALQPLLSDSPERAAQLTAFGRLDGLMKVDGASPTAKAADTVLSVLAARQPQRRFEIGT